MRKTISYKSLAFLIVLLFATANCFADPVDSLTARTFALNFYNLKSSKQVTSFRLVHIQKSETNTPTYYVFNANENDGFVIISANDFTTPIIGYSTSSTYNSSSPEFRFWISNYENQISLINKYSHLVTWSRNSDWSKFDQPNLNTNRNIIIGPLLTTKWNQKSPYNEDCPGNSVTGCVATAMAQIMKYWNFPTQGIGEHIYTSQNYGQLSANFGSASYDWSAMTDNPSSYNAEIAKIMYHCGVSVDMNYSPSSSGAWVIQETSPIVNCAEYAFKNYFRYNSTSITGIQKNLAPFADNEPLWINTLKNELNNNRPLQYAGYGPQGNSGHTWVCDGYDDDNYFHMNWGWGGYCDGYYLVNDLAPRFFFNLIPTGQSYNIKQEALIGISPYCTVSEIIPIDQSVSSSNISPGTSITAFCAEENNGQGSAGANKIKLYLSSSSVLNTSTAIYLGQILISSVPALGQTILHSTQINIPPNLPSGQYWLFYFADADLDISECFEDNNFASVLLNISPPSCPQPTNDGCTGSFNATSLGFGTVCNYTYSTSCGATSSGFNSCTGNADDDVFFRFVPTSPNATIRVSSTQGYDAVFQLLKGPCGTSMQQIAPGCINNTGIGAVEIQSYSGLITGSTYFIRVWHTGSGWGTGNFSICVYGNACNNPGVATPLSPGNPALPGQIINTTTPQFSWTNATNATTYVLRISKEPYGFNNIVYTSSCTSSPHTLPAGLLENGSNYRWDIEALYACGSLCSSISPDYYFTVSTAPCAAPSLQSSNISFQSISSDQMGVSWTNGNGNRRIVKINTTNSFTPPVNGTILPANSNYNGSGEQVVYDGNGANVLVTGLSPGVNYCFRVYEANCSGGLSIYNTTTAGNNPICQTTATSACMTPSVQAGNLIFSNTGTSSITVNWSAGNGNRRIVKINTVNSFTVPSDGTSPAANSIYSGSGEQVIYNGAGTGITVSGLVPGSNYCFRVYEARCSGSQSLYNNTASTNNPACQSTNSFCVAPIAPEPLTGNNSCPGTAISTNSFFLKWSGSGNSKYDIEVRQYPYGITDIVHSQFCVPDTSITINNPNIAPGKLYSWKVRANSDCNNCSSSWSQSYYFHKPPSISPSGDIFICNNSGITLSTPLITVPLPATVNYQWYKYIDGVTDQAIGANSNSYFAATSGIYYVKLIYTGAATCTGNDTTNASAYDSVFIGYNPPAPTIVTNSPVQQGSSLTLNAATQNTGSNVFFWQGPNGFASANTSNTLTSVSLNASGIYSCYLVSNGCISDTATVTVYIIPTGHKTYRYWFDNQFTSAVNADAGLSTNFTLQQNISISQLSDGLHSIHIQYADAAGKWSSIVSSFFYKPAELALTTPQYEYWFDNDYQNKIAANTSSANNLILLNDLPANTLPNGLHTLHIRFKPDGKTWSSTVSSFFYKADATPSGNAEYEYWFDNNYAGRTTTSISGTAHFILLDSIITNTITNGLHTLHYRFRPDGKTWSSVTSSFFYKDNNSITGINNLAQYVYWFDYNWQNPQTITITGVQNLNWTLNTQVDSLSNGPHVLSQAFKDDKGQWSSIVSTDFTKQSASTPVCLSAGRQFIAGVIAGGTASYQWQLDSGSGFTDISNNAVYSGADADTLQLTNAPTSWYGYKFRCRVTNGATILYGPVYTLKFASTWTGGIDDTWENPANWSCGIIPDANTDVYVNSASPRYPQVNSTTATCRSLNLQPGTSFEVKPGFTINITGKN